MKLEFRSHSCGPFIWIDLNKEQFRELTEAIPINERLKRILSVHDRSTIEQITVHFAHPKGSHNVRRVLYTLKADE